MSSGRVIIIGAASANTATTMAELRAHCAVSSASTSTPRGPIGDLPKERGIENVARIERVDRVGGA